MRDLRGIEKESRIMMFEVFRVLIEIAVAGVAVVSYLAYRYADRIVDMQRKRLEKERDSLAAESQELKEWILHWHPKIKEAREALGVGRGRLTTPNFTAAKDDQPTGDS